MALHHIKHQDQHHSGIFTRIAHEIVAAHDWLVGPAMSERDRVEREIAESRHDKHLNVAL